MKRSEINANLCLAKRVFDAHHFRLPRWAHWSPDDWKRAGPEAREIRECMLGWDITDFGLGDFARKGLTLFTIRNGRPARPDNPKTYAEKIMLVQPDQLTPMHFHWSKMEDIINRGGGDLLLRVALSTPDETLDDASPVTVSIDGVTRIVRAADTIRLTPGDSITLPPRLYHEFRAEGDNCMVGEVSKTNDDTSDNRFLEPLGRFPRIEEDEPPLHLLCNEYP